MNEVIFQKIRSDAVPNSMFRKRKTFSQLNFKRRRRKHKIDLKPQSPLLVSRYFKKLLPQFFFKNKRTQSEDTFKFDTISNCSPALSEITQNFFARHGLPIQTKSETVPNPEPKPSVKPRNLKRPNIDLYEMKNKSNLTKSLSARGFLDTNFFSLKSPLQYSVYPVHIFHYKRNVSENKHQSNPQTSQDHKAEVIYERKYNDKKKCKASKHNVKTSTKGLQVYSNISTQFEDLSNDTSNICQPQVTHKLAQYFEINPVPVANNKLEESNERVTNLTTFTGYLETKKGKSVLLNSHGKTSRKSMSPERDDNKECDFLCHRINVSSDDSTNKSSSNEDVRALYNKCKKCSLDMCNCANSIGNQKGSSNMLHNDCCTSTTEMCICSAMYPKFKEWYDYNSFQFNTDFKKWQEAQNLNIFNKEHHKLVNKNQHFTPMQEDNKYAEMNRKKMIDKSVIVGCLSVETPFVESNELQNTENSERQRYPTFIGIPIESDEPVKDVSSIMIKDEQKKRKIISDATLAEKKFESTDGDTPEYINKNPTIKPYRDISIAKGTLAQVQQPNPKTETECQIDLLKKSDFELVSDIEKMVENLISRVPSLSKSFCKTISSQNTFQKESKPAEYWSPQEEPKPAEYWTLQKLSSRNLAPNLQLQPLNYFHLKETQEIFQRPQTIMPLFQKSTNLKSELNEATLEAEKQMSSQTISNLPKLQHISATAITISEPELSHTRTKTKLKESAVKLSLSKLTQPRTSESKFDPNSKKERQRSDGISAITYFKKRDTLSPLREAQILIKTEKDRKIDSSINVIRSKASVSTKSSQSSNKSSVQSFIKSLLLCLKYSNSDSQVSFHDISIQCSESSRDLLLKRSASNCSLKTTEKTESLFSSYSSDAVGVGYVENSEQVRNGETNRVVQKMVEKGTMKANVTNSVGVQVYITTKHVKDKNTSASSLARRRRKRRKQREASTQTYFDARKTNLMEASSSSINFNKHKRQDFQLHQRQRSRKRKVITTKLQTNKAHPTEIAKLEKQLWNNFRNFLVRFVYGSILRLSNETRESTSAVDNGIELNNRSSVAFSVDVKSSLISEKNKKSDFSSVSMPAILKPIRSRTETHNSHKLKRIKSLGDIVMRDQKIEAFIEYDYKLKKMIKNEMTTVYPACELTRESNTLLKKKIKSEELQCDEIDLLVCNSLNKILENLEKRSSLKFAKCNNKNHNMNAIGYYKSEESIFGIPVSLLNLKKSDSFRDSKQYSVLFKSNTSSRDESRFTITECFKASNQNNETSDNSTHTIFVPFNFKNQLKYKICPTDIQPVFHLNIANVDTKFVGDTLSEHTRIAGEENVTLPEPNESSEQYTFENLQNKPMDDEHVLRLRFLWLKSGLRKHMSQLSNLKIMPIYDSDKFKRHSTTSETIPPPILMKIGAKPLDFEIIKEETQKKSEKEEESESGTTESTKTEDRDTFTPIAQFVNVLGDKGNEKFEICAILSVSSDSEEEGMEFAKAIESEEGMKAFLKTMKSVPHEIPKLKEKQAGCRCKTLKTFGGSKIKVDDMDMTYTPSKLIVTVPLPKKERNEQNIDYLEQLKRKLGKIFSNKCLKNTETEISFSIKEDIEGYLSDIIFEEPLQRKQSHVIIDTSNKAYNDKTKNVETKQKFPTLKEMVDTLPDNIKTLKEKSKKMSDIPKKEHKTKLPILKGFTRTFNDKFKRAEQKIRLDSELPGIIQERDNTKHEAMNGKMPSFKIITVSNKIPKSIQTKLKKRSSKQTDAEPKNISGGDDQVDIQENLRELLEPERFSRDRQQGTLFSSETGDESSISTEEKIEKIKTKLKKVLEENYRIRRATSSQILTKLDLSPDDAKETHKEKFESRPHKTHLKLDSLLTRLSNKLKETNDKIKQSIETTCKTAKRKRDSGEITWIRLSKKLVQQDLSEKSFDYFNIAQYPNNERVNGHTSEEFEHNELTKHIVSQENIPNQIRNESKAKMFSSCSNIRSENEIESSVTKSKMEYFNREVFKKAFENKSSNFKFRGLKHERRTDLTNRKVKNVTNIIEKGSQTAVQCTCPRSNRLSNVELKDSSYHSQIIVSEGNLSRKNFQSQFNTKAPIGRLICDCNELKEIKKTSKRENSFVVKSEQLETILSVEQSSVQLLKSPESLGVTYKKSENFEKPLIFSGYGQSSAVPSTSEKTSITKMGPSSFVGPPRIERSFFKVKVVGHQPGQETEKICQIKYCGIQHPVLNGGRNIFKNDETSASWKPNYCGLENYGPPKTNEKFIFNRRKMDLPETITIKKKYLREDESLKVVPTSYSNTENICSDTNICLEQIGDGEVCTSECQTRNLYHRGKYYVKHRKTLEGEYHTKSTYKMCKRNKKKKHNQAELRINRIELERSLHRRNMPHSENFKSKIDINWPFHKSKFWQSYYTKYIKNVECYKNSKCSISTVSKISSIVSFYDEIVCPKSTIKDEGGDLFTFLLSRNNSESNCFIVEETPSYQLVPILPNQENTLYLDQKRSLKMLHPLKSETERHSSESSTAFKCNHSLFKSKTVHILPNKFSQNYLSVNSICNLDSITSGLNLYAAFNMCSGKVNFAKSIEYFELWDAQIWNELDLCPLALQNYYRKQVQKLLKDD